MKFAHMSDCHIGSWRDPKMREISMDVFLMTMDECVKLGVDFILISGDLFNTSLPGVDRLRQTVEKLKEVKDLGIPVYFIAGSHDYSYSGKTMLDVLESAGLGTNVVRGEVVDSKLKLRFTTDAKTGVKLTGILGKKGALDKLYYENLIKENLENESGPKIFMLHFAIEEFKPKALEKMEGQPVSFLPRGFNYYAAGHVHYIKQFKHPDGVSGPICYPGALFPNNFKELEEFGNGGFYLVEDWNVNWIPVVKYKRIAVSVECDRLNARQTTDKIIASFKDLDFKDALITIRVTGVLDGRVNEIEFKEIFEELYNRGAYFVMKNTNALVTPEFEEIKIESKSVEDIEESVMREHIGQVKCFGSSELEISKRLFSSFETEKFEGERLVDFEARVVKEINSILGL